MATYTADSTKVGTSLVAAAGTMTALAIGALPTVTDKDTQVCITDGPTGRTLFAATIAALAFLWEPRPGFGLTPGLTPPAFPRSLFTGSQAFANGLYVKSCPAGISLTVTA
jgi:hypothetical protein